MLSSNMYDHLRIYVYIRYNEPGERKKSRTSSIPNTLDTMPFAT
jgi:hypothetical protein